MDRRKIRSAHTNLFGTRELAPHSRYAVIVAHPDDEIIGAGGLISRLENVTVLHITDGVPGNGYVAEAGFARRSDYAKARRTECKSALALANVSEDRIVDLGLVDSQASHYLSDLTRKVATFLQKTSPDVVLTHPYEGSHPDHDATAFATHAALRLLQRHGFKPPTVFEIALHPGSDGTQRVLDFLPSDATETTTLILDKKARDLKRRMFECLITQADDLHENALGPERFRRPPPYDFAAAPRGGKANYEKFDCGVTGDEWRVLVRQAWTDLFPDETTAH
ncbi:MAG: PIG-L deacetylase family protein [Pyrinomonadaceae bacterium]